MSDLRHNIILAPYTVYKIGGPARFFAEVRNEREMKEALDSAAKNHATVFILGAGSNILVSDKGFDGLVIHIIGGGLRINGSAVTVDAGIMMPRLAIETAKAGLSGLEWGAGVPGTVGGAVRGNAGCFGGEIKDVVESVNIFDVKKTTNYKLQATNCEFDYRESIFKKHPEWIILSAVLKLKQEDPAHTGELLEIIRQKSAERIGEQPIGESSAGSIFKGVPLSEEILKKLGNRIPWWHKKHENSSWVFENRRGFISAGFFIETAGLKGERVGNAVISPKHANFIVNLGNAKTEDVLTLISIVKDAVMRKFGVMLEEEIQYVGF